MKALVIVSNDFEITELLATVDCLNRASIEVVIASMNDEYITSQNNITIKTHKLIGDVDYKDFDFLIISGGKQVFKNLDKMPLVDEINRYYFSKNKLCAYICAACHLPGKLGLLDGYDYTVFPGCEGEITKGNYLKDQSVVVSKNVISARSMYYSCDFALAIIEYMLGIEKRNEIEKEIKGLNN